MKSIRQKILVCFLSLSVVAAVLCGGLGIAMSYTSSQATLEQSMVALATETSGSGCSYELHGYKNAGRGAWAWCLTHQSRSHRGREAGSS